MTEEMNNKFDFVISTLQVCIGILEKMKGEERAKYPMQVGLLTETNADLLNVKEYLEVRIKDLQERYQQKH